MGASIAVEKLVARHTGRRTAGADEDTLVHVGSAVGTDDFDRVTVHVDLARNVDNTLRRHSELHPRIGDLTVDHLRVLVDSGARARHTVGEGESGRRALGKGQSDEGLLNVDPGSIGAPADEDDVLVGLVGEGVGVGAVGPDPD